MDTQRNALVWQIGNTGFRNPERLLSFLRLVEAQPHPIWASDVPNARLRAHAAQTLAQASTQARSRDPHGARELMRIKDVKDDETPDLTGVAKALAAAQEFGLMRPAEEARGHIGKSLLTAEGVRFLNGTDRARRMIFAQMLAKRTLRMRDEMGSPLQRLAEVFEDLRTRSEIPPHLTQEELGWCIMPSAWSAEAPAIVDDLLAFREEKRRKRAQRESKEGHLQRQYARLTRFGLHGENAIKPITLKAYADVTARHLLLTGLFTQDSNPKRLMPDPVQKEIWKALAAGHQDPWSDPFVRGAQQTRLETELGCSLDPKNPILKGLELMDQRATANRMAEVGTHDKVAALLIEDCAPKRIDWDGNEYPVQELRHCASAAEWAATAWTYCILNRQGVVPTGKWNGRLDGSGRPEHPAPGKGPDAALETETAAWVIETTLLTNSRQDAAEGESVRRHVAQYHPSAPKPIWGLFGAPAIDNNTLMSFAVGGHMLGNEFLEARVIPMTFQQMHALHQACLNEEELKQFCQAIWEGRPDRNLPPPQMCARWRQTIAQAVAQWSRAEALPEEPVVAEGAEMPTAKRLKGM